MRMVKTALDIMVLACGVLDAPRVLLVADRLAHLAQLVDAPEQVADAYRALRALRTIADAVHVPVIASGGAGKPEHLYDVLTEGRADAALVAGILHDGLTTVSAIKREMHAAGIPVRGTWS